MNTNAIVLGDNRESIRGSVIKIAPTIKPMATTPTMTKQANSLLYRAPRIHKRSLVINPGLQFHNSWNDIPAVTTLVFIIMNLGKRRHMIA